MAIFQSVTVECAVRAGHDALNDDAGGEDGAGARLAAASRIMPLVLQSARAGAKS